MSLMRSEPWSMLPDLFDWLDEPLAGFRPMMSMFGRQIRFEDFIEDDRYVLRAELPGIDPDKDVEITLSNGILTVHAERRHEEREAQRSEFRYGSFTRSIALPAGADENDVKATYDRGILEISVGLRKKEKERGKRIPIERAS
ncbi:hypothetical protein TBS_13400 [Thermobispora bispora]|jgi:HSP20 family protein|uniref:Heat shock protein Hsp20 n=1 Tax=Thermobispora bispora (strain ATCC 19993 / DSM 43833 / CBS 139.67 / JCM 10125 / KCTC 9307 / NBRC 14880 / R51) TaxID=469371 RepID=D6Y3U2_THEBD|nr:Hsp20/alpha crystallin family protein [Thermobispora bispora]MBO2475661.1 Hsp20/alpha crystallin family protein [Actinomycetales bacterium]MDI9579149.1 Hsp20/alpha crystallin family protein [Thermobispora sp.]ADG89044.1 heat shock protein Hsp20 [Thermobispora bispora DSM 43833]MBX6166190.1 Hsp20/alpha crystallin family protein [Thermobispora bispora]QSI48770.1 Hsp20/alpha crystallin family protein [Thermobispora bispora]